jgi:hypothetical protein
MVLRISSQNVVTALILVRGTLGLWFVAAGTQVGIDPSQTDHMSQKKKNITIAKKQTFL